MRSKHGSAQVQNLPLKMHVSPRTAPIWAAQAKHMTQALLDSNGVKRATT